MLFFPDCVDCIVGVGVGLKWPSKLDKISEKTRVGLLTQVRDKTMSTNKAIENVKYTSYCIYEIEQYYRVRMYISVQGLHGFIILFVCLFVCLFVFVCFCLFIFVCVFSCISISIFLFI